jgi:hypothetical protein
MTLEDQANAQEVAEHPELAQPAEEPAPNSQPKKLTSLVYFVRKSKPA